ncbi:hypothetical protein D9M70_278910 [compost metagenome]
MAHRHAMSVHRVRRYGAGFIGREVGHDLVTIEVEIDPVRRTATLGTAEQVAVEVAGGRQVVDRKGKVEGA